MRVRFNGRQIVNKQIPPEELNDIITATFVRGVQSGHSLPKLRTKMRAKIKAAKEGRRVWTVDGEAGSREFYMGPPPHTLRHG